MTRFILVCVTLTLMLTVARPGFAASVTISPTGSGVYSVQGDAMDGVAGIDLTVFYDSSSLSAPTVSQGSLAAGALMAANTANAGVIKIAIISTRAFSGSGQIATISFAGRNGTTGITSAAVNMISTGGAPVAARVAVAAAAAASAAASDLVTQPGVPFSQTATAADTAATGSAIPAQLGTVSMPTAPATLNKDISEKNNSEPAPPAEPSAPAEAAAPIPEERPAPPVQKAERMTTTSYTGILERFRMYRGEKKADRLGGLFRDAIAPSIRQEPAVVLSDGRSTVRVAAALPAAANGKSPNFFLDGAKLVSLKRDERSAAWVVEVLPQENSISAMLTILNGSDVLEFPLTVAPPLPRDVPVSEVAFAAFLAVDSKTAPLRHDLNGDGRYDAVDDYIYTANYLVQKTKEGKKRAGPPAGEN